MFAWLATALAPAVVCGQTAGIVSQTPPKPQTDCFERTAEDWVPMTQSERLADALRSIAGPAPVLSVAARAGIDQGWDRPKEWHQGTEGFALRFGSLYAELFIDKTIEAGIAYKLHEDNRYFASGSHNFARRFGYAVSSTVLARHDDGSRAFSISVIGGAAGSAFISRAWQPRSTTSASDAAVSFGLNIGVRLFLNLLREFSPRTLGEPLR